MSDISQSTNLVSIADLYTSGQQHADGSLTIPWDAIERWATCDPDTACEPPPAAVEVLRAGGRPLPGFDEL